MLRFSDNREAKRKAHKYGLTASDALLERALASVPEQDADSP
jgi:hypothetical protein